MTARKVDILLATYNGARFLPDLLGSLDRQTSQDWRLIVRDDGSTDESLAILRRWGADRGAQFSLIEDGRGNIGASANFGTLLQASAANYFLPCDQDDFWLPDRVARLISKIGVVETGTGPGAPVIVHTDLIVTDDSLQPISPSFWNYQRLNFPSDEEQWKFLTLQNVVTGCAMIGNAALREFAQPVPRDAMMHDWWLALVAAIFGRIVHDPKPSILYRQHGNNTLGAKSWSLRNGVTRVLSDPMAAARRSKFVLAGTQAQARAALERFGDRLDPPVRHFLQAYSDLPNADIATRKCFPFRHRLWFDDVTRNLGLIAFI